MTSSRPAPASDSTVGHRSIQASKRGTTRPTCVCWSITSETSTAYGSRVLRQGRSRPFRRDQVKSAESIAERLLAAAAPEDGERLPLQTPCEHPGPPAEHARTVPDSYTPKLLELFAREHPLTPEEIGNALGNGKPFTKAQGRAFLRNLSRMEGHLLKQGAISRPVLSKGFQPVPGRAGRPLRPLERRPQSAACPSRHLSYAALGSLGGAPTSAGALSLWASPDPEVASSLERE